MSLCLLQGCVQGVRGHIDKSTETFSGIAITEISDLKGMIKVSSSKGASCRADFAFKYSHTAGGIMNCDDGRSGPFELNQEENGAVGYCNLSGENFLFTSGY